MVDQALPADFEHTPGSSDKAMPPSEGDAFDIKDSWCAPAATYDGDGGMVGRVLIYASIVAVVAVMIWERIA
jgi:hypothetical protein